MPASIRARSASRVPASARRELASGGCRRHICSMSSRCAKSSSSTRCRRRARPAGTRRRARQSRFRAQVVGHEDGRRSEAVRRRCRAGRRTCFAAIGRVGLAFEGFHILCRLAESEGANRSAKRRRRSLELAVRLAQAAPAPVRVLNLGGGFGIPYFPGRDALDLAPIGDNLRAIVGARGRVAARCPHRHRARPLPGRRSRHLRVPRRRPQDLARPRVAGDRRRPASSSRGVGQFRPGDPQELPGRDRQRMRRRAAARSASVVGPLCTPLDLLADRMDLAVAQPGDLVVVFQSGAYGATASPQGFLSHPPLVEALV